MPDHVFTPLQPALEPAARAFVEAAASAPSLHGPGAVPGRESLLEDSCDGLGELEVDEKWVAVSAGPKGSVAVRILRPRGADGQLPAILYVHGDGWLRGSAQTHDRLARELVAGAQATLVFPEYTPSTEARYSTAPEECYAVARWIAVQGSEHGIDRTRLAVVGDSVGGAMSAALTLLAKARGNVSFTCQVLLHPVMDADSDICSRRPFAGGNGLRRDTFQWFRDQDQYTTGEEQRAQPTAGPLKATERELRGLPPALVITAEADVMRDEGEAYAAKLRAAGVEVVAIRYGGTVHDFVVLNALSSARAAGGAVDQVVSMLRRSFGTGA